MNFAGDKISLGSNVFVENDRYILNKKNYSAKTHWVDKRELNIRLKSKSKLVIRFSEILDI